MELTPAPGSPPPDETLVFVYGSLLRGECNHRYLNGARFLGEARTEAEFFLVDLGGFPGMAQGGCDAIDGELYAIDASCLLVLDELEDHPEYFRRSEVTLEDGRVANGYLLPGRQANSFPCIRSGSWRKRA